MSIGEDLDFEEDFEGAIKSGLDTAGGVMQDAMAKTAAGVAETAHHRF